MHESSLIDDLIQKINTIVMVQGGRRAVVIKVKLGALSHISPEHFKEHFAVASRNTLAEGAFLDCETSEDINEPSAQEVVLQSVSIEI